MTGVSPLKRVLQQVGMEQVLPHLHQASETELQESFGIFLHCIEGHTDLGISENFNPTTLPSLPFIEVKNATEDIRSPQFHEDVRSPLMDPFFSMNREDVKTLMSYDSSKISLIDPPLNSNDYLGCRVFFRVVAESVEQGYRIVVLTNDEHTLSVSMHIKELRKLKPSPDSVGGDVTETLLMQVEYHFMSTEVPEFGEESLRILADLVKLYPKNKTRVVWGTGDHVNFVHEILRAHERLLENSVVSAHDVLWNSRKKYIRPSFIVPLKVTAHPRPHEDIPASTERTPSERAESENADPCAVCGKTEMKLKVCPCKLVKYCSRECQTSDWKFHKKTCRTMRGDLKWSRMFTK